MLSLSDRTGLVWTCAEVDKSVAAGKIGYYAVRLLELALRFPPV